MKLIGIARLGKDADLQFTSAGKAVCNMLVAYNHGKPNPEGRKATQWVEVAFWGEKAERLHKYLKKSTQLYLEINDVRIELFDKKDGDTGYKLCGNVWEVQLIGGKREE